MQASGATESGYGSVAILGALLEKLITLNLRTPASAATDVLDEAVISISLKSLGNLVSVPGAIGGRQPTPQRTCETRRRLIPYES